MGTEPYEEFPFINAKNNNGNAGESQSSAQNAHRAKSCTYLKQGPSVALSMPWGAQGCARPAGSAQSGASPVARDIPAPQHKPRALHPSTNPALCTQLLLLSQQQKYAKLPLLPAVRIAK